jgi:hypothetical protein
MISLAQIRKAKRNFRATFLLGFILALMPSIAGGIVLFVGHSRPDVMFSMPAWQYGQFIMLFGLLNLFVYVCLFIQVRKLIRGITDEAAA